MSLRIQIGAATILGRPLDGAEPYGLFVKSNGFEGWDDGGGETRQETQARPNAHGSFDEQVWQGSRVCSVSGWALAPSAFELAELRNLVTGALADGRRRRIVVTHQEETLWAWARRAGRPRFVDAGIRHGLHRAEFFLQFTCPDPRKYGEMRTFQGPTAQVFQRGNFPALPVIEVTGTLPGGYQVASQGRQFNVTQALASGQTHRLDMASGWLYRNNALQTGAVATAETFEIPPGKVTPVVFTPASGSGQMTVKVHDTYT